MAQVEVVTGQQSQQAGPGASPADDARSPYDSLPCNKLPPVPDLNNNRFCRACRASLHVDAFPPGKRRYLCRRHTWLRNKKPSMDRALADPRKKLLRVLWRRCWVDAKKAFGHTRIALLQRDIAKALSGFDFGEERSHESAIALVPANPTQLLSHNNLVVVENNARRHLLRAYLQGGETEYVSALEHLD
jgi:hypothetical protein